MNRDTAPINTNLYQCATCTKAFVVPSLARNCEKKHEATK